MQSLPDTVVTSPVATQFGITDTLGDDGDDIFIELMSDTVSSIGSVASATFLVSTALSFLGRFEHLERSDRWV